MKETNVTFLQLLNKSHCPKLTKRYLSPSRSFTIYVCTKVKQKACELCSEKCVHSVWKLNQNVAFEFQR